MEITTADLDDVEGLASCIVPAWLEAHRDQIPNHLWQRRREDWTIEVSAAAWKRTLAEIASEPETRSHVLVTTELGAIVGLVAGTLEGDDRGQVDALYVMPSHQRQGVGRRLLSASFEALRSAGASHVRIVVLAANAPARRFYESVGGHQVGLAEVEEDDELLPAVVYEWPLERQPASPRGSPAR